MSSHKTVLDSPKQFSPGDVALPATFEPLEADASGKRYETVVVNDFEKHKVLNPLLREAIAKVQELVPSDNYQECVVEVGSWAGANAIAMAQYLDVPIYCIDTWQGGGDTLGMIADTIGPKAAFQTFCRNCWVYLYDRIIPCVGHSRTYAEIWPFQVPAVFIDADHSYESCKQDLEMWWEEIAPGGVIVGHDFESWPGVRRAAEEFGYDGHEGELFWRWKHTK